jgi:hypothetical protein
LKRLAGKTDIEDALKRLDKLTNEEARMATAQVLKATHNIDDSVKGVDDRVAAVDAQLAGVNDRVVSVDKRVRAVDGKVAEISDGAYIILNQSQIKYLPLVLDGKQAKVVLDEVKCPSFPNTMRAGSSLTCSL